MPAPSLIPQVVQDAVSEQRNKILEKEPPVHPDTPFPLTELNVPPNTSSIVHHSGDNLIRPFAIAGSNDKLPPMSVSHDSVPSGVVSPTALTSPSAEELSFSMNPDDYNIGIAIGII